MANDTSDASVRRQTSACSSEVPAEEDKQRHRSSCHSLVTFLPHSVFGRVHSFFLDSAPLLPVSRCCAGASCSAVAALVLLSSFWWVRREKQRRGNMSKSQRNAHRASKRKYQARKDRKNDFLDRAGDDYGYRNSPGGHIDTWRSREFPHLIPPMDVVVDDASHLSQDLNQDCSNGIGSKTHSSEPEVYLDYAGAALPSRSQLEGIMSRYATSGALANPHSTGPAASRTMLLIDQAKKLVLDHFNGHPGKSYDIGGANKDTKSAGLGADHHSGYEMIFTSGTTESLRIVAESFRWTSGKKVDDHKSQAGCGHKSMLLYPHNSHTSVVGMRGPAMEKGGTFRCVPLEQLVKATSNDFSECKFDSPKEGDFLKNQSRDHSWRSSHDDESDSQDDETVNHLLALPLECNFGGDRPDNASIAELIRQARRSSIERRTNGPKSQWSVLLDIAKAASTGPVNLRELDPDFACLSFYKVFGEPTGLGVLFVKRSSLHLLEEEHADKNTCTNRYFGGGSVDVVLAGQNFVSPRSEPSVASSFVRGSVHFRGISTLAPGLEELKRVGGMKKISAHSRCLAKEFVRRMGLLKHGNGLPLCVIYGAWSQHQYRGNLDRVSVDTSTPGPTVAFNILRSDGTIVGYSEVSSLAGLNNPPIQLRTGCFCNAGACQRALGLCDGQIRDNFLVAGHVCGDKKDIINGMATGAIRASFGKDSLWEDVDALLTFLENKFASAVGIRSTVATTTFVDVGRTDVRDPVQYDISEIFVFPIKSCAAMPCERWQMDTRSGRLIYDREFALVDSSGAAMRLHSYPRMGLIAPSIDLERSLLIVSAPGRDNLTISLASDGNETTESSTSGDEKATGQIRVCGSKACANVWGGNEATEWFSSFLGVQCWLVRHKGGRGESLDHNNEGVLVKRAFANEASLLLVSQSSIDELNAILSEQRSKRVTSRHFRPNLVVKSHNPLLESNHSASHLHPEDSWSRVELIDQGVELVSGGPCARCQMVDVDPSSGMKCKALRALSEYRRRGGQIIFGIFLSSSLTDKNPLLLKHDKVWVREGDVLRCFQK